MRALVAAAALLTVGAAHAAGEACLLEGEYHVGPRTIPLRDCMQNTGAGPKEFAAVCDNIAQMGAALGAPPKVTHPAACPPAAQGTCDGVFGAPIRAHYYARSPQDLADAKSSCVAQGGRWGAR